MSMASLSLPATPPSKIQVFQYILTTCICISVFVIIFYSCQVRIKYSVFSDNFTPSKNVNQFLPAICMYEVSSWVKRTLMKYQSAWNLSNLPTVPRPQEVWNSCICICICICILVSVLYFYIVFQMFWPSLVLRRCAILVYVFVFVF